MEVPRFENYAYDYFKFRKTMERALKTKRQDVIDFSIKENYLLNRGWERWHRLTSFILYMTKIFPSTPLADIERVWSKYEFRDSEVYKYLISENMSWLQVRRKKLHRH